ncbi:hypothetical protein H4R21_000143, partial [Coemansia helicoidea]
MSRSGLPANHSVHRRSARGLFSVRGLPAQLHLDGVYRNGLHELLPFWVANESAQRLVLDFASMAEGALEVQRSNANWDAVGGAEREAYVALADPALSPTGYSPGEVRMVCNTHTQRAFSEVFNQLGGIDRMELAPGETVELVLVFVSAVAHDGARTPEPGADEPGGGAVRFGYHTWSSTLSLSARPDQGDPDTYTSSLRVSLCRSVLEMDPPTSRVYLDDCVSGRVYERVLWVQNASAIGLDWTMTVVETTDSSSLSSLEVLGGDLQPLAGGHLAGGASAQVVVRYTPRAAGEFLCRFLIENSNDPANMRYWVFRARASPRQKPKRVELLSDPNISFGNCTSGAWYSHDAVFKNVSETPVVLRLRVEGNTGGLTMKSAVKVQQDDADASDLDGPGLPADSARGTQSRRPSLVAADGEGLLAGEAHDEAASEGGSADSSPAHSQPVARMETRRSSLWSAPRLDAPEPAVGAAAAQEGPGDHPRSAPRVRTAAAPAAHSSHRAAMFDEVLIKPGAVRTVTLALMGNPVSGALVSAGQFGRQSFTLFCECRTATGGKQAGRAPKGAEHGDRNVERLSIPCTVNMCTPFVRVTPALLDFGSVDVGTLKTMRLLVENLSQVEATVQCALESKVINCSRSPIAIPPMQSASIRVDIYPRRINARYRKQIIVRNKHNRLNDCIVEVRSTHVDDRHMAFHNLFYKTLVPCNEQNFVDFGTVPLNSQVLRKLTLRNICRCPIDIEVSASDCAEGAAEDGGSGSAAMIAVYTVVPLMCHGAVAEEARRVARQLPLLERQAVMHSNIERFKEHPDTALPAAPAASAGGVGDRMRAALRPGVFVDKSREQGHVCLVPFRRTQPRAAHTTAVDYLDVATAAAAAAPEAKTWAVRVRTRDAAQAGSIAWPRASPADCTAESRSAVAAVLGKAQQILDEIIEHLDAIPQTLFASPEAESEYVRRQVDLRKYMDLLVESGYLRPARRVTIPALGDMPVLVILRPAGVAGAADKAALPRLDANLYFRLAGLPRDMLPYTDSPQLATLAEGDQLPMRRFLIQAALCTSELDIGQKSVNVGNMQVDEASRKYLVVQNRAETPLMYAIRKTGSIASGDICFVDDNRYGVVRGFDSRKIVFVFTPSLTGVYNEQISIANVLNALGGKKATLKAVVRRPSKLYIQSLLLEFGSGGEGPPLAMGQQSVETQLLVIKNMTSKARHVLVKPLEDMRAEPHPASLDQPRPPEAAAAAVETEAEPEPEEEAAALILAPLFPADVAVSPQTRVLDRDAEEKIESLEQKLKIAIRKNRPEKVAKYQAKLAKLRGAAGAAEPEAAAEAAAAAPAPAAAEPAIAQIRRLAGATQLAITLPANGDVSIPVAVVPRIASYGAAARLLGAQSQVTVAD